jgi:hypothetical protein
VTLRIWHLAVAVAALLMATWFVTYSAASRDRGKDIAPLRQELHRQNLLIKSLQSRIAKDEKLMLASSLFSLPGVAEGLEDRSNDTNAKANVRATIPAVEAYNADNTGTGASAGYAGMTVPLLQAYDSAIVPTKVTISSADSVTYCVESTVGGKTWSKNGPGADIVAGPC